MAAETVANRWLAAIEKAGGTQDRIAKELCTIAFKPRRGTKDTDKIAAIREIAALRGDKPTEKCDVALSVVTGVQTPAEAEAAIRAILAPESK